MMTQMNIVEKELMRGQIWICESNEFIRTHNGKINTCLVINTTKKESPIAIVVPLISSKRLIEYDKQLNDGEINLMEIDFGKLIHVHQIHALPKSKLDQKVATLHSVTMNEIGTILRKSLDLPF